MVPEARRLVLVRHGETDWNRSGRAQGHADVPLNATGHAQAKALALVLADLAPARLWSSDLARARETAEAIAEATALLVELDPRLREYDVGERSGLTLAEAVVRFPEQYAAYAAGSSPTLAPGEETTADVHARVVPALTDCLRALGPGQVGVVVLHGACLKVGLTGMLGWPWEQSRSLQAMENAAYCVLTEDPSGASVRLTSYNEKAASFPHGPDFTTDGPVG